MKIALPFRNSLTLPSFGSVAVSDIPALLLPPLRPDAYLACLSQQTVRKRECFTKRHSTFPYTIAALKGMDKEAEEEKEKKSFSLHFSKGSFRAEDQKQKSSSSSSNSITANPYTIKQWGKRKFSRPPD